MGGTKPRTPCRSLVASGHFDGQRAQQASAGSSSTITVMFHQPHGTQMETSFISTGPRAAPKRQLVGGEHLGASVQVLI